MVVTALRCEMVVREGQQLQQIAAIYRSDWLQLWSHNQAMMHPDMELNPHQVCRVLLRRAPVTHRRGEEKRGVVGCWRNDGAGEVGA